MTDDELIELPNNIKEINNNIKKISCLLGKEHEHLLKHLAAAAIHITLFMKDFTASKLGISKKIPSEDKFLEQCGCFVFKEKE